jgi:hypothetical protein
MPVLYTNNATTRIVGSILAGSTTITITSGSGELFPNPTGSDYFYTTLIGTGIIEIIKVETRTDDTFTNITRGVDGTSALAWPNNAQLELRTCRILLQDLMTDTTQTFENILVNDTLSLNDSGSYLNTSGSNLQFTDLNSNTHTLDELSTAQTIDVIAGETLLSNKAVMISGSKAYYFDTTDNNNYNKCIGITKHSSLTNENIRIITSGKLNTGITLADGNYFANGTIGNLTNYQPANGISQIIGTSISNTELLIDIKTSIILT